MELQYIKNDSPKKDHWLHQFFYGNSYGMRYCSYLLRTNHKRPCPPGKDCTVKVPMKVMRRKRRKTEDGNT